MILNVAFAKNGNSNTLESALEKSAAWAQDRSDKGFDKRSGSEAAANTHRACSQATSRTQPACTKVDVPVVDVGFRFEGKVQARSGGRSGKLNRGFLELSPNQCQLLQRHPLWQEGFKLDVRWHWFQCENRAKLCPRDLVTFTVIVDEQGDGMQAQHIKVKQ